MIVTKFYSENDPAVSISANHRLNISCWIRARDANVKQEVCLIPTVAEATQIRDTLNCFLELVSEDESNGDTDNDAI